MSPVSAEMVTPAQPLVGMVWLMVRTLAPEPAKMDRQLERTPGLSRQEGVKGDDVPGVHVLEGLDGVLIFIEGAAADADLAGGLADGGGLADLQHPLGLGHLRRKTSGSASAATR